MRKPEIDNLTTKIPYFGCINDVCVTTDGSLFACFKIDGLDSLAMPIEQLTAVKGRFQNIFAELPVGYVVQIYHENSKDDKKAVRTLERRLTSQHPVSADFKASHLKHLRDDHDLMQVSVYVCIIRPRKLNRRSPLEGLKNIYDMFRNRQKGIKQGPEDHLYDIITHHADELKMQAQRCLEGFKTVMGINGHMLLQADLERLVFRILNPGQQMVVPGESGVVQNTHANIFASYITMRERLTLTAIEEHSVKISIGDKWYAVLTLKLPSNGTDVLNAEFVLGELNYEYFWSFNFTMLNTAQKNASLELRQKRKHAIAANNNNPTASAMVSLGENEQALTDQTEDHFLWHDMAISFVVVADNEQQLKDRVLHLKAVFKDLQESVMIEEGYAQLMYFLATLPGCGHLNDRRFLVSSLNVADMVPLATPPAGTDDLDCYFHTQRNTLFRYSTFSDEFNNWNQVVIGKIGSGKSFMVNHILTLSLMAMDQPRVMILDLGHSFKKTTELWGGKYMTIDLNQPDSGLNPLPTRNVLYAGGGTDADLLEFTVSLIMLMADSKNADPLVARVLRKTIQYTYQNQDGDPILSDLYRNLINYQQINKDAEDEAIARKLSKLLEAYIADGPYAKLFDRHSTLGFDSDFFCFDFKSAAQKSEIREIATYIVGGMMSRKMTENSERKVIIFDEFATTMKHETGAALCRMISKNCRKHGTAFICISQEIGDFVDGPAGRSVLQQAQIKWLLKLDDNLEKYKADLKLTPTDINIIQNLHTVKGEYAEVFLVYGDKKTMLKLKPDPLTYWACTTDARDKLIMEAYLYHHYDQPMIETLKILAGKYPYGVLSDAQKTDQIFLAHKGQEPTRRVA